MIIRELFNKSTYVVDNNSVIENCKKSYPNEEDVTTILCYSVSTLSKNLKERTAERDNYLKTISLLQDEIRKLKKTAVK